MAITGIQLRCSTQETKALTVTVPSGGSATAGGLDIIGSTVGVYVETKDVGEDVALVFSAAKILLPKLTTGGSAVAQGGKIYFTDGAAGVTGASGGTLCGRALAAAIDADTTVLAVLNGDVAA